MANTLLVNLAPDNTNFTTWSAWAKGISDAIRSLGWIQSADTGQVVWTATVLTCSAVAVTGGNSVYTFSSYTGPDPRVGMSVTITGFGTGGNNVTATLTALTGGTGFGAGTFTVATTTQVNETHAGSATTTAISVQPAISTTIYEMWKPNDAFQATCPIFIKMEYGSHTTQTYPLWAFTVSSATNGSGGQTNAGTRHACGASGTDTTVRECAFCGDGTQGRLGWILFRGSSNGLVSDIFAIERSRNNAGTITGDYFTYFNINYTGSNQQAQRSWVAGSAPTVELTQVSVMNGIGLVANTGSYNNFTYFSPIYPLVGQVGNPMTMAGAVRATDIAESTNFNVTLYGTVYTMRGTKVPNYGARFGDGTSGSNGGFALGWY